MRETFSVFDRMSVVDRTAFYAPGSIGRTRKLTPEGYMVCEGVAIARTGEQRYHEKELPLDANKQGEIIVTRGEDEVFSEKTIASFEGKPVTLEHPNEFVTPDSWKKHSVGTVQNVRRGTGIEDDMLLADLLITDGEAIAFVNKKRPELSCGYDAEYEQQGEGRATQYNIVGNHVALLTGRGRAGSRCAIRDATSEFIDTMKNHGVHSGFDPGEKRDKDGKWTTGNRNKNEPSAAGRWAEQGRLKAEGALRSAKRGNDDVAIKASVAAHQLSVKAKKSKLKSDHDAATLAHARAATMNEEAARVARNNKQDEAASAHRIAHHRHEQAMSMHNYAAHETKDSTTGDSSMKQRFADKFMRVMQAFHQRDAEALDAELTEDGTTSDGTSTDDRIQDALAWIDEQRAAARAADAQAIADAAAKKKKDEEEEAADCEMKKKAADAAAAKAATDSAAALEAARNVGVLNTADQAQVLKHIYARAEILSPGIAVPTGDSAAQKSAIPALMLKAVQTAFATEAGKAVIEPFLLGEKIEAVTVDNVAGVFTGAAELMRQRNNREGAPTKLSVKDFGRAPPTAASLNETNRKFWASRSGG